MNNEVLYHNASGQRNQPLTALAKKKIFPVGPKQGQHKLCTSNGKLIDDNLKPNNIGLSIHRVTKFSK